ncbi:MAG: YbjN domain-containing protein [Pseudomonadota bacterium]
MTLDTMSLLAEQADPIDLIEELARASDLESQRVDETEVHVCLTGSWRDISLWFAWREEAQVLQIGAPLELKVPPQRASEVLRLLAMVNERLWIGHFDLWGEEHGLVYRNGAVLAEGQGMAPGQAEILLRGAMDAFDRYYPAFNYVIWGGKTAEEALVACILEPVGTA